MICCIEHICAASLHYVLFGAVSGCQLQQMTCRTDHIYATYHRRELEGASLDKQLCQMICHIVHIHATSLHCELEDAFSGGQPHQMIFLQWAHLCTLSPLWVSKWLFRWEAWPNDLLHWPFMWLLSTVSDLVVLQVISLGKWFVTLSTFVQFFSTVNKKVPLQYSSLAKWFVAL